MTDPSDLACVEYLRPKSIPEGLVAIGTVIHVSDNIIKLQIAGGLVCLVTSFNISCHYSNKLKQHLNEPEKHEIPAKLSKLFKISQQYVCKVIEKRPRPTYADALDIYATLDPQAIQEDNLPKTFIGITNVPIQCSVRSVEDYGYQMDMGFKNVFGFLTNDNSQCRSKSKLVVGQIVRCCIYKSQENNSDNRVVPLKIDTRENSPFSKEGISNNIINERCILPGSSSFLTVMKVAKEGLIVNFMNDYAGFVNKDHLRDHWHSPQKDYKISDEFDCVVLYYNPLTKLFCLSLRKIDAMEQTMSELIANYSIGKIITNAEVAYTYNTKSIVYKVDKKWKAVANIRDSLEDDLITASKDEIQQAIDEQYSIGSRHKCRVKSINLADQLLIVSTKKEFLELSCVSVNELSAGDSIDGKVKKIVKDGIVITFGLNLKGIIRKDNLENYTSAKSYKRFSIGQSIKCRVLRIDTYRQPPRVFLTNKVLILEDGNDKNLENRSTKRKREEKEVKEQKRAKKDIKVMEVKEEEAKVKEVKKTKEVKKVEKTKKATNREEKNAEEIDDNIKQILLKSRRQRSEEARLREQKLYAIENELADPNRPPQSISDFERLVLKTPDSAFAWIKYSKFFLENLETEKARIICRRALRTISFRLEKEKVKVWLQLIKIEAKYGGQQKLHDIVEEALKTNDKLSIYQGACNILAKLREFSECDRLYKEMLKDSDKKLDVYINQLKYLMEFKKDIGEARSLFKRASSKNWEKNDLIMLNSQFGQLEFKFGDPERGKTIFQNLTSDYHKRKDLEQVYAAMLLKYAAN